MNKRRMWACFIALLMIVSAMATPLSAADLGEDAQSASVDQTGASTSGEQNTDPDENANPAPGSEQGASSDPDGFETSTGTESTGNEEVIGDETGTGADGTADAGTGEENTEETGNATGASLKIDPTAATVNGQGHTVYGPEDYDDIAALEWANEGSSYTYYEKVYKIKNTSGPAITFHAESGLSIIEVDVEGDGSLYYYFKDLNSNGELDNYEDWRLSTRERAEDLVAKMVMIDEETGDETPDLDAKLALMLHHVANEEMQIEAGLRFELTRDTKAADAMAENNNERQYWAEIHGDYGIPVVTSTDPRHTGIVNSGVDVTTEMGGTVSLWPNNLGIASSFDPDLAYNYGQIVAEEYRALGIHMQLGPQMDLITDPRWSRDSSSWSEDLQLTADMSAAFIDAMQTDGSRNNSDAWGIDDGWGPGSVATMAKHWPSGGSGEFGFDGHYDIGKFGVYPGNAFEEVLEAFAQGAGLEETGTKRTSSIMPYYTISWEQSDENENVANGFSDYIINKRLRGEETGYGFDGLVCTDWMISRSEMGAMMSQPWGLESAKGYTEAYRMYRVMMAGVDQHGGMGYGKSVGPGGNTEDYIAVLRQSYEMGANGNSEFKVEAQGYDVMDRIVDAATTRIVTVIFNLGLFEDAYADPDYAKQVVGNQEKSDAGYEAHEAAVIMLKNTVGEAGDSNIFADGLTVYVPVVNANPQVSDTLLEKYYDLPPALLTSRGNDGKWSAVSDEQKAHAITQADFAVIKLGSPSIGGSTATVANNLTYSPYTADWMREESIGYDWYYDEDCTEIVQYNDYPASLEEGLEKGYTRSNRSLHGTTHNGTPNSLNVIRETWELVQGLDEPIPIVFILSMENPMVLSDVEPYVDVILVGTNVSEDAFLRALNGENEPSGLLAVNMPMNMETVELSYEDAPHDMVPYKDSEGNRYTFGFGLDYSGQITDSRVSTYARNTKHDTYNRDGHIVVLPDESDWYPNAEKRHLQSLIDEAKNLNAGDYTHASYTVVSLARSFAESIDSYDAAGQSQVNTAASILKNAIRDLDAADGGETGVNKESLAQAITMADEMIAQLSQSDYTAASWSALTNAIDNAQKVYGDISATQQDVSNAITGLDNAIKGLELRNTGGNGGGSSSSRGSGGGGGNGGQSGGASTTALSAFAAASVATTSANVNTDGSVNQTTIAAEATSALSATAEGGTATVRARNAKSISAAALNALAEAAVSASKSIVLHADTMSGGAVQGRLYVEPGKLSGDLQLGVYTADAQVSTLKALFGRWFSNKLAVVRFDQQGGFGAQLRVAAKVDLTGMNTDDLRFYSYDQASNSYRQLTNTKHFVDSNGYLHFYTEQAGSIIISEGALARNS